MSQNKKEIPVLSKDEVTALYTDRAQLAGAIQEFRNDGSPIVGAVFGYVPSKKVKVYKGKKVFCSLLCCSQIRPPVRPHVFSEPVDYSDPTRDTTPKPDQWIKVEPRSVRRKKRMAQFASSNLRANNLYSMYDD
jgi:hypothetical protein